MPKKNPEISVEKVVPSGALRLTHFQDGAIHARQYIGYSKKDALKLHKETFFGKGKGN